MTEQDAIRLFVNALRRSYEACDPRRVNDLNLITQNAGIPEELAHRAVAQLRAEQSIWVPFGTSLKLTDSGYKKYFCEPDKVEVPVVVDLEFLKYPQRFHELCRDLMSAEYPRYQGYEGSGGDEGIDGYEPESGTLFQFHYPRRGLRKEKLAKYLEQAKRHPITRWVLVTSQDLTVRQSRWLESVKPECKFEIQVWGPATVYGLIEKHRDIATRYFSPGIQPTPSAINVHAQTADQIVNVVGPTVIKATRPTVKRVPIPGTVGANPYMKGELKHLVDRLAEFRSWDPRKGSTSKSVYPVIYKNYLRDKGCAVNDTPQNRFVEAKKYFQEKIDNTKLGRINTGKGRPNY
jgi:hypothetical protein